MVIAVISFLVLVLLLLSLASPHSGFSEKNDR